MAKGNDIVTKIREIYDSLSKSHQRLADYILDDPGETSFISINELGHRVKVSPATITRFVRHLNFAGYADFQRELHEYQKQLAPFGQLKSLLSGKKAGADVVQNQLELNVQRNIRLLQTLVTPHLKESFERAQKILYSARTIYVAGQRSSYATAYYLAFMLQQICDNVKLLTTSVGRLPEALNDVSEDDCLLTIAYAKYSSITYDIVCYFNQLGCKVISLTDSMTSPIARKSTEVLIAPNGENFSPVGAITLCNCFVTLLGQMDAEKTMRRMEKQEKIASKYHIYL